ncbi:hypothetical protein [Sphingobacterium bambusae]|uniref:Lasso RiPP family leader peptide-containing protein n=1 Tax=Sphingobacterium bambusae TaxID=662858 RepID=A0ABW6BEJ7_9SPHI|nr:hypothetical protein [Sphingobacterium bambusae]WPL46996.1 hypothetical protein SCB77_13595 [Sphingobacterium bambusae]
MKKRIYARPKMRCDVVYLESAVVAASTGARINPGSAPGTQPQIEDWNNGTGFSNDMDL